MKRIIRYSCLMLSVSIFSAPAIDAQAPPPLKEKQQQMAALDFLVGEWAGEGWAQLGAERSNFIQTEKVTRKLGGLVLVVEGLGKNESGAIAHQAYATIYYDAESRQYRFDAHTAEGRSTHATAEAGENSMVWGFDTPFGRIRYTLKLTETGLWHEIGEGSSDGETWHQFLEMTLKRVE